MATFKFHFIIIVIFMTGFTTAEVFEIIRRRSDGSNGWQRGTDSFKINNSLFDQDAKHYTNCAKFNAQDISDSTNQCHCTCSSDNATLIFSNNEWKCLKNSNVRTLLEFDDQNEIFFKDETKDSELRMLDTGDVRRIVSLQRKWTYCVVDQSHSWYIGCNGSKVFFSSSLFAIVKWNNKYYITVNRYVLHEDRLRGRIINLRIKCTKRSVVIKRRLLFKFEGALRCSISWEKLQPALPTKSLEETATATTATRTTATKITFPVIKSSAASTTKSVHLQATQTSASVLPTILSIHPTALATPQTTSDTSLIVVITQSTALATPQTTSDTSSIVVITQSTLPNSPSTISITQSEVLETSPTIIFTSPSMLSTPSTISASQSTISSVPAVASTPPPTTRVGNGTPITLFSSNVPTNPSSSSEQRRSVDSPKTIALIAGAVSVLLILISCLGFLFYRRHYSNKTPRSGTPREGKKVSIMMNPQTNSAYEPDDHLYKTLSFSEPPIYALPYKVPHVHRTPADDIDCNKKKQTEEGATEVDVHYAPLKIPQEHNIYRPGNNADHDNENVYQNYNSICAEPPVYNFIEELSTLEGSLDEEAQPMYDVLEGPCFDEFDHYGTVSSEEPVYTTLERPYQKDTEGPFNNSECVDEPIYNVLEEGPYPSVSGEDVTYGT